MFRILLPVSEGLWLQVHDGCSSCWTHFLPIYTICHISSFFQILEHKGFFVSCLQQWKDCKIYTLCPFSLKSKNQCRLQRNMEITPPNCPALNTRKLSQAILIHTPLIEEQRHTLESTKTRCVMERKKNILLSSKHMKVYDFQKLATFWKQPSAD